MYIFKRRDTPKGLWSKRNQILATSFILFKQLWRMLQNIQWFVHCAILYACLVRHLRFTSKASKHTILGTFIRLVKIPVLRTWHGSTRWNVRQERIDDTKANWDHQCPLNEPYCCLIHTVILYNSCMVSPQLFMGIHYH